MAVPDKSLTQHEIDLLLQSLKKKGEEVFEVEYEKPRERRIEYDFKKPERVARDQLRQIETMHEIFTRNFQAYLSTTLRTVTDVRIEAVEQLIYSEFVNSVSNPTVFNIIACEPLEGNMIVEISPNIAFTIIARLLGSGNTETTYPDRALTDIEWGLISGILNKALSILEDAWAHVVEIKFRIIAQESNPRLVQIIAPNEPIIFIMIRIAIGECEGHLKFCIPIISLETVLPKFSASLFQFARKRGVSTQEEEIIKDSLNNATVTLICDILRSKLKIKEVAELAPGDIIVTNIPATSPVIVSVEGEPKYHAVPGAIRGYKAVKITSVYSKER